MSGLAGSAQAQVVTGTATYRERMALPVGATFEATLEDVSRADAAADVIGRARIDSPANPPYKFSIKYDPSKINPQQRYSVRARIMFKDDLLFTSDQAYPVITGGNPNHVSMVLRMVVGQGTAGRGSKPSSQGEAKAPPLVGTHWTLSHLGETAVTKAGNDRDAHLVFASEGSKVSGSTGCNRLTGTYTQAGDALSFGPAAVTRMACISPFDEIETKMLAALKATVTGKITGSELALSDKSGKVVARFVAK